MRAALFAAVLAGLAGAAQADPLIDAVWAKAPEAKLSLPSADAEAYALKRAGLARTAVERRSDAATAALGFLCGLKDSADRSGGAAARGVDPHGRFLGARLSLSFR
jgi:hypothetical protein